MDFLRDIVARQCRVAIHTFKLQNSLQKNGLQNSKDLRSWTASCECRPRETAQNPERSSQVRQF